MMGYEYTTPVVSVSWSRLILLGLWVGVFLFVGEKGCADGWVWFLECAGGKTWNILGTSRDRDGLVFSVEVVRPERRFSIAKIPNTLAYQSVGLRYLSSSSFGGDVNSVRAVWFSLGGRWVLTDGPRRHLYLEAGTGVLFADRTTLDIDSKFNFASYIGFGSYFNGSAYSPRLGVRITHISNGGIKPRNRGLNLVQLVFGTPL
ncbi:MAG: acyloxyacyl hydrolase [Candidatus Caldarchaeum sp.]